MARSRLEIEKMLSSALKEALDIQDEDDCTPMPLMQQVLARWEHGWRPVEGWTTK